MEKPKVRQNVPNELAETFSEVPTRSPSSYLANAVAAAKCITLPNARAYLSSGSAPFSAHARAYCFSGSQVRKVG
jgi:hypothetical protein